MLNKMLKVLLASAGMVLWIYFGLSLGDPENYHPAWAFAALYVLFFNAWLYCFVMRRMHFEKEHVSWSILCIYVVTFTLMAGRWLLIH